MVSTLEVESSIFVVTLTDPILTKKQSKFVNFGPKMAQNKDLSDFPPNYAMSFHNFVYKVNWFVKEFIRTLNLFARPFVSLR